MKRLIFVALLFAACAADTAAPFVIAGECTDTCGQALRDCTTRGNREANRCYRFCVFDCFSCDIEGRATQGICERELECAGETGCARDTFSATLGSTSSRLENACRAYADHVGECGGEFDPEACVHFAAVEDPSLVEVYDCLTAEACGQPSACALPVADGELAAATCAGLTDCGWTCDNEEALGQALGWMQMDVRDSLRGCLDLSCNAGRSNCTQTWFETALLN